MILKGKFERAQNLLARVPWPISPHQHITQNPPHNPPVHPLDLAKRIPFWIGTHSNVTLIPSYIHHWIVAWKSTLNGVRYGWFLSHTWSIHRPFCPTSLWNNHQAGSPQCCCPVEVLHSWLANIYFWTFVRIMEILQVLEMQQRKCSVIFDLSCNLARVLEFCTCEIPQAFLSGPGINLQRLTELIIFILNHVMMAGDSEFFDL